MHEGNESGYYYGMKEKSEEIRIRHVYRKLIVTGKTKISLESARALVGPDCAYHLYGLIERKRMEQPRASIKNKARR